MFHVKTASVRDLRQNFPRVLAWINDGEEVAITLRREEIARLVPHRKRKARRSALPDLAARLDRVFGSKVISDTTMQRILEENKGAL